VGGADGGELIMTGVASGADEVEVGLEKWMKGDDHGFRAFDKDALPL
jgi:hypothetical protein